MLHYVADSNSKKQNIFIVNQSNANNNKFYKVAWKKKKFPNNQESVYEQCLDTNGCYKTIIKDKAKNGMCCESGEGGYVATFNGEIIMDTLTDLSFVNGKFSRSGKFGQC